MAKAHFGSLGAVRNLLRASFPRLMYKYELYRRLSEYGREIEEDLLPAVIDRRRDAVDVGAYLGTYATVLAGLTPMVYAFEPERELAMMLRRAAPANVRVWHNAVSDREGTAQFHVPLRGGRRAVTLGSLIAPTGGDCEVRTVRTVTLDGELRDADVGFIKIDVEGAEPAVLAGARRLIARCQPVILAEANTPAAVSAVSEYLRTFGYTALFIYQRRVRGLQELSADMQDPLQLQESVPRRKMRFVNNFLFVPASAAARMRKEIAEFL